MAPLLSYLISPPFKQLTWKHPGGNSFGYQMKEPSQKEREAGRRALLRWKKAPRFEKFFFATDIVLGKALNGMTSKEVSDLLGVPNPPIDVDPYYSADAMLLASKYDLCLVIKNDKISDTYIEAAF